MFINQHLKTTLAVALALGLAGAPAASARPDLNGAPTFPAPVSYKSAPVRPNPDEQTLPTGSVSTTGGAGACAGCTRAEIARLNRLEARERLGGSFTAVSGGSPAVTHTVIRAGHGFDWGDAGIGAAGGLALSLLAVGGALSQRRAVRAKESRAIAS
jgi:hypothetical protein